MELDIPTKRESPTNKNFHALVIIVLTLIILSIALAIFWVRYLIKTVDLKKETINILDNISETFATPTPEEPFPTMPNYDYPTATPRYNDVMLDLKITDNKRQMIETGVYATLISVTVIDNKRLYATFQIENIMDIERDFSPIRLNMYNGKLGTSTKTAIIKSTIKPHDKLFITNQYDVLPGNEFTFRYASQTIEGAAPLLGRVTLKN